MNFNQNQDQDSSMQDLNVDNIQNGPEDTVSCIAWAQSTTPYLFAAGSWDSKVRLFEVVTGMQKYLGNKKTIQLEDTPLSLSWTPDCGRLFAGQANNAVSMIDINTGKPTNVGIHDGGVKDVYWINDANVVVSLSFDKTLKIWDCRQQQPAGAFNLGHKVFASDMVGSFLAIGLSEEKILITNLSNLGDLQKPDYIESPLGPGSQLTCISFSPTGNSIGLGSFDGRANLSNLSKDNMGKYKLQNIMTFKCHKREGGGTGSSQTLFPVNGIGFHPKSQYFVYTAGAEGNLIYWDYNAKSKIKTFEFKGNPVSKVKMSPDGLLMAYALGYDWNKGLEGYGSSKPKICCHILQDQELIYKTN